MLPGAAGPCIGVQDDEAVEGALPSAQQVERSRQACLAGADHHGVDVAYQACSHAWRNALPALLLPLQVGRRDRRAARTRASMRT